jgi:hypothetical protein
MIRAQPTGTAWRVQCELQANKTVRAPRGYASDKVKGIITLFLQNLSEQTTYLI